MKSYKHRRLARGDREREKVGEGGGEGYMGRECLLHKQKARSAAPDGLRWNTHTRTLPGLF